LFEPLEFLEPANEIGGNPGATEAHFRRAIGRAYYAMHLKTQSTLERARLYEPRSDASDHFGVIRALRQQRRIAAAHALSELRRLREIFDYRLDRTIAAKDWLERKAAAVRLVDLLSPDWA
jgi:uncharacterized protein (UPF0332 family)